MSLFSFLARRSARFATDERGNIAIIAAVLLLPLITAAGGVVDMVGAVNKQNELQAAADAAALASARADLDVQEALARATFMANLSQQGAGALMTFVRNPDGSVTVGASLDHETSFLFLAGLQTVPVRVESKAVAERSEDETRSTTTTSHVTTYRTACMLVATTGGSSALTVNSPAKVDGSSCEVHVKSSANDAFMFNSGTTFNASKFCIAGTATVRGATNGAIEQRCDAADDSLAGTLPTPPDAACTFTNFTPGGSNVVLTPGTYCGWTNFNGGTNVTLTPGTYVIKNGGWNINDSNITGSGVTLYLTGSGAGINMNGSVAMELTAPTSGTYQGILLYQNPTLPESIISMNGTRGQYLEGLVYLPTQEIHYKSKSKMGTRDKISMVVRKMIIDGETDWKFEPAPDYQVPGSSETTETTTTSTETIPGRVGASRLIN